MSQGRQAQRASLVINGGDLDSSFDFVVGEAAGGTGYFDMTGGTLIVGRHALWGNSGSAFLNFSGGTTTLDHNSGNGSALFYIGRNDGATGDVTMSSDAIINVTNRNFIIGSAGTGTLTISDTAAFNVEDDILMGTAAEGEGTLIVTGGTVSCNTLEVGRGGAAYAEVSDGIVDAASVLVGNAGVFSVSYNGTFRVDGHVAADLQDMEADGRVVAYGGRGSLIFNEVSDPNKHTEVTAAAIAPELLEYAYGFSPAYVGAAQDSDLAWTPGDNSVSSHVYFGTDAALVAARDGSTDQGIQTSPFDVVAGDLELGQTYYWAVDEFDGAVTSPSDVIAFTVVNYVAIGEGCNLISYDGAEASTQLRSGTFDLSDPALNLLGIELSGSENNDIVPLSLSLAEPGAAAPNGGTGWSGDWEGNVCVGAR